MLLMEYTMFLIAVVSHGWEPWQGTVNSIQEMGRDTASYRSPEYIWGKWEFQEGVLWEEIEKKVVVYENIIDVEDLNYHNAELLKHM